jgi:hypothetical protein
MQVPEGSPHADGDSLVHGLLNVSDLLERRVDVWINNFPGATHLLDVYSNRRVDKRRAFPSQYTRLQHLQEVHHRSPHSYTVRRHCRSCRALTTTISGWVELFVGDARQPTQDW